MKITIIGSTCSGQEEALKFAGHAAGICYMPDNYDKIKNEPLEKTLARAKSTLQSGHHSVYDHIFYNLLIEDIPKILAMILNNEGFYTTSEKSARYTKMKLTPQEQLLYDKWLGIFKDLISAEYGERFKGKDRAVEKLAMENARYMISVFTPTTMLYTVSLRQLNYIINMFSEFSQSAPILGFYNHLRGYMQEFLYQLPEELIIPELNGSSKGRKLSFFSPNIKHEIHFGETYSTCYFGTWAQLAQAQRHRTLNYSCEIPKNFHMFIPRILPKELHDEWEQDITSVFELWPQGMAVKIFENGTYDNFLLKCYERVCGCVQLEIQEQTLETLERYHEARPDLVGEEFLKGARCTYPNFKCDHHCVWGAKDALTRKI